LADVYPEPSGLFERGPHFGRFVRLRRVRMYAEMIDVLSGGTALGRSLCGGTRVTVRDTSMFGPARGIAFTVPSVLA
jgi:hypothetical protein